MKKLLNFILAAPAVLLLNTGELGNIPNWIWWTLFVVGGTGLFYFIVHLELGRRLKILTQELREKNLELQNHKEHLEELISKRTTKLSESEKKYRLLAENS